MDDKDEKLVCLNCGKTIDSFEFKEYCTDCCWTCSWCEDVYIISDPSFLVNSNEKICASCHDESERCSSCGQVVPYGSAWYCDGCDDYFCSHCFNNHFDDSDGDDYGGVHNAGYKPQPIFYPRKGTKELLYHGVELEVDDIENANDLIDKLVDMSESEQFFYLKEDGSLKSPGIEIVTHPRTIDEHRKFFWNDILDTCKKHGAVSHDGGRCGLHVHSSIGYLGKTANIRDIKYYQLAYIYDKFFDRLKRFSRRENCEFCHKPLIRRFIDEVPKQSSGNKRNYALKKQKEGGRYLAVTHTSRTIETRLWRGTLKYDTLMAHLEFTDGICKYVKNTSVAKTEKAEWKDIITRINEFGEYKFMNDKLNEMGLI